MVGQEGRIKRKGNELVPQEFYSCPCAGADVQLLVYVSEMRPYSLTAQKELFRDGFYQYTLSLHTGGPLFRDLQGFPSLSKIFSHEECH